MNARRTRVSYFLRPAVLLLFGISGATGLVYEVTWARRFGVVFGNTVFASSAVLTAFMLGLAIGSYLIGRRADRTGNPLALYSFLEIGVGLCALLFGPALAAADMFYTWLYRAAGPGFYAMSLVRLVLSAAILIAPTALMGGTLPVLVKLWGSFGRGRGDCRRIGAGVGLLYAINTFGAVAGTFLAGYFFIRLFGISRTLHWSAAVNIGIGVAAFVMSRRLRPAEARAGERKEAPVEVVGERGGTVVLVAIGAAGFCALALEVLWTRVLVFVLGTSAYAFACMLTCFVFGTATGSLICSAVINRIKKPVRAVGLLEMGIGLTAVASLPVLAYLWGLDYRMIGDLKSVDFWREVSVHFADTMIVLGLPTILMGAAFPIAVRACTVSYRHVASSLGRVYACNTLGCVLGAFVAGFVLVPVLGLRGGFLAVIAIQLAIGPVVLFLGDRRAVGAWAGAVAAVVIAATVAMTPADVFVRTINTYHYPSKVIYIRDGTTGTITVHDVPDGRRLISVDGVDVAGVSFMLRTTQKLQAYVPLLVHENPKKVVQIGFGSGETSGIGLAFGVEDYRIVEICPGVFEAGRFFDKINRGSYKDPRLKKVIMDGKNFVKLTDEKFDVIMNDSTYPGTTGSSALYTYDHFKQCRDRLNKGGVLSCWLPIDLRGEELRLVLRSFQAAMPYSSLWMADNCLNKHAVLLGTMEPMKIDFARLEKVMSRKVVAADLAEININNVYDFLDCMVVGPEAMKLLAGEGPLNTDDFPALEFRAAIKSDFNLNLRRALAAITMCHSPVGRYVDTESLSADEARSVLERLNRYYRGTGFVLRGQLAEIDGDSMAMRKCFEAALKVNPDDGDVGACIAEIRRECNALAAAVEESPGNPVLVSRLAEHYTLLGEYEEAAGQYAAYLSLDPGNAGAYNNLGLCLREVGRDREALRAFETALQLDGRLFAAAYNIANIHAKIGNAERAASWYERSASMAAAPQQRVMAYRELATLHAADNRNDLAVDALNRAIEAAAGNAAVVEQLNESKRAILGKVEAASGGQ